MCVCEQIQASKRNKENRSTWCSRRNQQGNSAENHVKWNWITENFWLAGICVSKGSYTCCVCVRVRWAKKRTRKEILSFRVFHHPHQKRSSGDFRSACQHFALGTAGDSHRATPMNLLFPSSPFISILYVAFWFFRSRAESDLNLLLPQVGFMFSSRSAQPFEKHQNWSWLSAVNNINFPVLRIIESFSLLWLIETTPTFANGFHSHL